MDLYINIERNNKTDHRTSISSLLEMKRGGRSIYSALNIYIRDPSRKEKGGKRDDVCVVMFIDRFSIDANGSIHTHSGFSRKKGLFFLLHFRSFV